MGGAGTTAIGPREACPTIIVPFFGDQPFWGNMVAAAGAGPKPIPQKQVSVDRLVDAIRFCQSDEARKAAAALSAQIKREDGVQAAVRSFHASLPLEKLKCDFLPERPACWHMRLGGQRFKMSRTAAEILIRDSGLTPENLKP